jgi:cobalamin synthase
MNQTKGIPQPWLSIARWAWVLLAPFAGASGQQSILALVISTLAIAALSNPLRRRIQGIILLGVVTETIQPEVASLWTRKVEKR